MRELEFSQTEKGFIPPFIRVQKITAVVYKRSYADSVGARAVRQANRFIFEDIISAAMVGKLVVGNQKRDTGRAGHCVERYFTLL